MRRWRRGGGDVDEAQHRAEEQRREDEHRLVHGAMGEVWQDTNDPFDETFEEWAHWHVGRPSYDPSLWFLAFAGDELAGVFGIGVWSRPRSTSVSARRNPRGPRRARPT